MEKSKTLQAEEATKVEPYFVRPPEDDAPDPETMPSFVTIQSGPGVLVAIDCYGDWVVIDRDHTQSIVVLSGDTGLPTGTVVGINPSNPEIKFADRVYFSDRMIVQKVQHPAYPDQQDLVIVQAKNVFFKIPE